ncbi:hypothetical protein B0T20DRAFT_395273 [Sordaria brevicollis]|uniref:Uncharacterized protein n=1 Tax=Sordaria brevicollis TaxID=83679 RepID=A0AAE0U9C4_SORBR|nr:hypothetical protein B0T20DRAFT_395273 [Sordaria brevicollis]
MHMDAPHSRPEAKVYRCWPAAVVRRPKGQQSGRASHYRMLWETFEACTRSGNSICGCTQQEERQLAMEILTTFWGNIEGFPAPGTRWTVSPSCCKRPARPLRLSNLPRKRFSEPLVLTKRQPNRGIFFRLFWAGTDGRDDGQYAGRHTYLNDIGGQVSSLGEDDINPMIAPSIGMGQRRASWASLFPLLSSGVVEILIAVCRVVLWLEARGLRGARWNDLAAGAIRRIVPNDEQDLPAPEEVHVEGLWKGAVRRVSGYTTKQLVIHRQRLDVGSMAIQGTPS